ncbi:MAG: hypothetical protein P4L79_11830 [Legionella sp.]|uniref:hypothetical protein n=1 Tax=Legionella sp. TaxID=459 RepID=UPI002849C332|nr:hypothetical protein [Legionella sp.]
MYDISLYEVHYSQNGKYPIFYVNFKNSMTPKTICSPYFYKIGTEILKANSFYPYEIIDKKDNLKIQIRWDHQSKKAVIGTVIGGGSVFTCKSQEHTVMANENRAQKFILTPKLEDRIWNPLQRVLVTRPDGPILEAFLSAENERMEPEEYVFCDGKKERIFSKTGNYYIYLYDATTGNYLSTRMPVFVGTKVRMNIDKVGLFPLHNASKGKYDILFVSQPGCGGKFYEAYGFSENGSVLKKYFFRTNKRQEVFFGTIDKNQILNKKLIVYGKYDTDKIQKLYLFLSKTPGEIKLEPVL